MCPTGKTRGGLVEFLSRDRILKVMAITRYHFIAALPASGEVLLTSILSQNPRFVTRSDGAAVQVMGLFEAGLEDRQGAAAVLDPDQRNALLRGVLDAVHHDRPLDSVIFDASPSWLGRIDLMARIFPLSRFIVPVRNPAAIIDLAATQEGTPEGELETLAEALLGPESGLGRGLDALRAALAGRTSERILLIDYDRLTNDPELVLEVVYDFLREPEFDHDLTPFAAAEERALDAPVRLRRSDGAGRLPAKLARSLSNKAFWRNLKRTEARMLLGSG